MVNPWFYLKCECRFHADTIINNPTDIANEFICLFFTVFTTLEIKDVPVNIIPVPILKENNGVN